MTRFLALAVVLCACDDEDDDTMADTPDTGGTPVEDLGLAEWPQAYQDVVNGFGGSRFETVDGIDVHYLQSGPETATEAVVLVHGIPTHSYLWRNVLGELGDRRVIAPDLVGYGRSERPSDFAYTPASQVPVFAAFIDSLGLDSVHLVAHDLGGLVGLRWASENPEQVASITMFETIWSTFPDGLDAIAPPFGGPGGLLDQMRDPVTGPVLVGDKNVFLNSLSAFTANGLSKDDQAVYQFPWPDPSDRAEIFRASGPLQFPFPEDPEAESFVRSFQDYLVDSPVPKLVIDVAPGALSSATVPEDGADGPRVSLTAYAAATFPTVQSASLTPAGHFVQEDLPAALSQQITAFLDGL